MRGLAALVFVTLIIASGGAQVAVVNNCPASAPVSINAGSSATGTEKQVVTIQNKSQQPISAVILTWRVTDSNGKFYPSTSTADLAPSGSLLQPGQSVSTDADLSVQAGSTLRSVEITCEAVLFQGTDGWGDLKSADVARLRAVRRGISAERRRLQDVYKKEGEVKLLDEINRPVMQ